MFLTIWLYILNRKKNIYFIHCDNHRFSFFLFFCLFFFLHSGECTPESNECDADRTNPGANSLCSGCMDADFQTLGSTDNPSDCDNGLGINVGTASNPSPTASPVAQPTASPITPTLRPTNRPTARPSDKPTFAPSDATNSPTNRPTIRPTARPTSSPLSDTDQPNLVIENSGSPSSWYYSCILQNIPSDQDIDSFYISNGERSYWISGSEYSSPPNRWVFSRLGGMKLPFHVKIVNQDGEEIIVQNAITSFDTDAQFDLGTNFGVKLNNSYIFVIQ